MTVLASRWSVRAPNDEKIAGAVRQVLGEAPVAA
jgi:hypothetical protein